MNANFQNHLEQQLAGIRSAGTYKNERVIRTPQGTTIRVADGKPVLNLCANNYLGLAQHPEVAAAAKAAIDQWGYGMASVRFICGTQGVHKELEAKLTEFLGTEDTILYSSCFDANGATPPLRQQQHGRLGVEVEGICQRALPADRHRRRVFHGRLSRQPVRDL
jgi:glycine C-acetyltransferase